MTIWLRDHADAISALASVGMLGIWLLYLHLFYRSYRDHQRPMLLIHQAGRSTLEDVAVVANMSEVAVHVAVVLVDVERGDDRATFQPPAREREEMPALYRQHQGPIRQGEHVEIGSFRQLLEWARKALPDDPDGSERMEIELRVAGFVGSGAGMVGTRRRFVIEGAPGARRVRPVTPLPERRAGVRSQREVRRWLDQALALDERPVSSPRR